MTTVPSIVPRVRAPRESGAPGTGRNRRAPMGTRMKDGREYPAMFPAGFHDLEPGELDELFVFPFEQTGRRKYLVERLRAFLDLLTQFDLDWEVWLDGSFCTKKIEPDDIDVALFFQADQLNEMDPHHQNVLLRLVQNREEVRLRYSCDAYFLNGEDVEIRSYWRGWFGFSREEIPKGIPRLRLLKSTS